MSTAASLPDGDLHRSMVGLGDVALAVLDGEYAGGFEKARISAAECMLPEWLAAVDGAFAVLLGTESAEGATAVERALAWYRKAGMARMPQVLGLDTLPAAREEPA